jgi:DNA-dependent RNA polymerase auxiliary subunit epsilon
MQNEMQNKTTKSLYLKAFFDVVEQFDSRRLHQNEKCRNYGISFVFPIVTRKIDYQI